MLLPANLFLAWVGWQVTGRRDATRPREFGVPFSLLFLALRIALRQVLVLEMLHFVLLEPKPPSQSTTPVFGRILE